MAAKAKKKTEEENLRIVRCPVCDGAGEEYKKDEKLTICKCQDCGLLFQNPRPSLGYLALQRNERFRDAMTKSHGAQIREQSKIATEIMKGFHKHTSGRSAVLNSFGKNILDVNCELGFRLREFQKYGWNVYGIDTSKNAVEYAKACALEVSEAWLDTVKFKTNMFDLILFWNNFGELPDPKQSVNMLSDILKPKGLIFIHLEEINEEDFENKRLFYFDQDSLRQLFMKNGFKVIHEDKEDSGFFFWIEKKERRTKDGGKDARRYIAVCI